MVEIGKSSAVNLSPPEEVDNGKTEERQNDGQSTFGELDFSEYTQGGLGRHLGVFSTIFLMFVCSFLLVNESTNWSVSAVLSGRASSLRPLPSPAVLGVLAQRCSCGSLVSSWQDPDSQCGWNWDV